MPGLSPRLSLPPCTRPRSPSDDDRVVRRATAGGGVRRRVRRLRTGERGRVCWAGGGCEQPVLDPLAQVAQPQPCLRGEAHELQPVRIEGGEPPLGPWGVADSAVGASSAAERRSVWASSRACNRMQQRLQPYPKQRAPSGPVAAPAGLRSASPNPDPGPKPKQAAPAGLRRAPSPRPSSSGRRVGRCA